MNWQEIVKLKNLSISEVSLSKVQQNNRLDAEYYQPEYLLFDKKLDVVGYELIESFATITDGIHTSIDFNENSRVNLISAMSPKDNYFDISKNKTISEKQNASNPRTQLRKDDVIISTVGTIGNCAVVDETILPSNSDRHVGIVRVKDNYLPHFISTFLLSKYGRFQTLRESTGNVQLNLFIEKIRKIKILKASVRFQISIAKTVQDALIKRQSAENLHKQAEQLLLTELGLADYIPNEANTSIRDLFECLQDDRFDAEYWMPKYDEMQKRVAKVPQSKLGQIVSHKKGVEVGSEAYQEEGENFIRVSDFSIYGIEGVEKKISNELYDNLKKNYQPKKGEVLFTKDGTIGLSYALDEDIKGILSGAFLRLQPKTNINIHYLALVLNSLYCKYQIERMSGGAIIAHLKPESAMQINIPILSPDRQAELGNMVIQSLQKRNEAKHLLEKAKRAVEIFIEQDEEKALEYLEK